MLSLERVVYAHAVDAGACDGAASPALDGATFHVGRGERVAVLGRNGSGKSTLVGCACGRLRPTGGSVELDGARVDGREGERALRRAVGYVGQDPDDQLVASTLFDEVAFGPCNLGLPADEVGARVAEALRSCRLAGLGDRNVAELSGGERQRAALAGAVAMRPRYLLCDEPCSMLDARSRGGVLDVLDALAAAGCGVVHVTHELADVAGYDRAVVLDAGRVVWEGSPVELLLDEAACDRSACLLTERLLDVRRLVGRGAMGLEEARRALAGIRPEGRAPDGRRPACRTRPGSPGGATSPREGLRVRGASFSYGASPRRPRRAGRADPADAESPAVLRADLDVAPGEVVLLCGPTGSGKTTLARLAAGLYKPLAGSVTADGAPCAPGSVGYAFQRVEDQLFAPTVLEDAAFGPLCRGCGREEARRRAERALARVGLDPARFGPRSPFALSGGQMRRAALAGVLALERPYVVFDEPTVGLDAEGVRSFAGLLDGLSGEGVGVLVVSHDVERLAPIADRVVAMEAGTVREEAAGRGPGTAGSGAPGEGASRGKPDAQTGAPSAAAPGAALRRLDARVKLALLLAWTVALFQVGSWPVLCGIGVAALATVGACGAEARRAVRGLAPLAVVLAAIVAAGALCFDGSGAWHLAGAVGVSPEGLDASLKAAVRIAVMAVLAVPLTAATPAARLSGALRWFLGPLGRLRVPVDDVAMTLEVALRFVPLCAGQLERVLLAQRARGARVGVGGPVRRVTSWVPVAVPVLVGMFRRGDALSAAMASRCYRGTGRTRLAPPRLRPADAAVGAVGCVLAAVCAVAG